MGLVKRGDRWYIRRMINGRQVWRSLGPEVKTKHEAEILLKDFEKQLLNERFISLDSSSVTIQQWIEQFLRDNAPHWAKSTQKRYHGALKIFMDHYGEATLLRTVTTRSLSQYASRRLAAGVSPNGVNTELRHVKSALRTAQEWGWLTKAPTVRMVKIPHRLPRHIPPQDIDRIIDAEVHDDRKRLWIFMLWTGMRRGEAHGLKWQNITWGEKPVARVVGKGDKERAVPLLPPATQALGPAKDIGPIWPQVHMDQYTRWFHEAVQRAGLTGHRLHDLRHTCVTYMISRGIPVATVQRIVGHTNIATTMLYAAGFVGDLWDEMSRMLDGSKNGSR